MAPNTALEFALITSKATMESAPLMQSRFEMHLARMNAEPARDFT
jgi:hypothetical protein